MPAPTFSPVGRPASPEAAPSLVAAADELVWVMVLVVLSAEEDPAAEVVVKEDESEVDTLVVGGGTVFVAVDCSEVGRLS